MEIVIVAFLLLVFFMIEIVFFKIILKRGLNYSLTFSKFEAFEGEDMFVDEEIYNRKPFPVPWVKADIHSSKWLEFAGASSSVVDERRFVTSGFVLKAYQRTRRRWYMKCTKRGVFDIDNATVTCGDILGLITESKAVPVNRRLVVYPGMTDIDEMFFSTKDILGEAVVKRFILDDPFIVKGIRDYVPGDAINRINWKATAKTGGLMVNENDFTTKVGITVLMNVQSDYEEFDFVKNRDVIELAIKVSSTILNRGFRQAVPIRYGSNASTYDDADNMILTESGTGQEHMRHMLYKLAQVRLKNIRDFAIYLSMLESQIRDTQIYIVTAYMCDEIADEARRLAVLDNTVKILVLDTRMEEGNQYRDLEIFYMKRRPWKTEGELPQ
ncbi:MAG TPA: DUF58 domain-containing protein [Clostridia bacterium]|nr:DUF58 domain-containing protein [Clostridia bacterium]HRX41425.1 DUF58 domain-containing protein [Clostridia bacterium]